MTDLRCAARCGRPGKGGVICRDCAHKLRAEIDAAPGLIDDLETAMSRQQRMGQAGSFVPQTDDEQPLPFNELAGRALRRLERALGNVRHTLGGYAGVDLRCHPAAGRVYGRLVAATTEARKVIDRPEDRRYAGTCGFDLHDVDNPCTAELYAAIDDAYIDCPKCLTRWDVEARRDILQDAVREQWAYAALLERALDQLDKRVTANTVRQWAKRKRITSVASDSKGRPLYRVGDVLDVIAEDEARVADALTSHDVDGSTSKVVGEAHHCHTQEALT